MEKFGVVFMFIQCFSSKILTREGNDRLSGGAGHQSQNCFSPKKSGPGVIFGHYRGLWQCLDSHLVPKAQERWVPIPLVLLL
jgi:hypothetical protein